MWRRRWSCRVATTGRRWVNDERCIAAFCAFSSAKPRKRKVVRSSTNKHRHTDDHDHHHQLDQRETGLATENAESVRPAAVWWVPS
jgi:hypothetical protein